MALEQSHCPSPLPIMLIGPLKLLIYTTLLFFSLSDRIPNHVVKPRINKHRLSFRHNLSFCPKVTSSKRHSPAHQGLMKRYRGGGGGHSRWEDIRGCPSFCNPKANILQFLKFESLPISCDPHPARSPHSRTLKLKSGGGGGLN